MRREGEVVLVYYQDQPTVYARIESIEPDIKKGWFLATLLILTVPARTVTWILREAYIDGEPFTMGGIPVRLEEVKKAAIKREAEASESSGSKGGMGKAGRVLPFRKP